MNTKILKTIGRGIATKLAILVAVASILVACDKEEAFPAEEIARTEVIGSASDSYVDLKNGKAAPAPADQSIAEIAIASGFSELVSALSYVDQELNTGLVNLFLNGKDQFTVFAPTNQAFTTLYSSLEIQDITELPAELVLDVLLYHVVEGRRASNSVVPPVRPRKITTLLGLTFTVNPSKVITAIGNEATIVAPDISASNGIIHVIDAVILPF
jgi:uncharacterized surface protein with fasciclin (FAS1) repeats